MCRIEKVLMRTDNYNADRKRHTNSAKIIKEWYDNSVLRRFSLIRRENITKYQLIL